MKVVNGTHVQEDWVIADHTSRNSMPDPKPSFHLPAITFPKKEGHWLSRGRRLSLRETARLQGFNADAIHWNHSLSANFGLLGNTMSLPMV